MLTNKVYTRVKNLCKTLFNERYIMKVLINMKNFIKLLYELIDVKPAEFSNIDYKIDKSLSIIGYTCCHIVRKDPI